MSIDTSETTDTVVSTETSDNAAGDQGSTSTDNSQATGEVQSAESAPQADEARSTTTPDTTSQAPDTTGTQQAPAKDWAAEHAKLEHQYKLIQGRASRAEAQAKQYEGFKPDDLAALKKSQEQAKLQALKPWNPRNPNASQFSDLKSRLQGYRKQVAGAATPEAKAIIEATANTLFSPEEHKTIRDWDQDRTAQIDRFTSDPDGYMDEEFGRRLGPAIEHHLERYIKTKQEEQQVQQWMTDPAHKGIVEKFAPHMLQGLEDLKAGKHWSYVQKIAELTATVERLQGREGQVDKEKAIALAQQAATRKGATITRDGRTTGKVDVVEMTKAEAKKRGWRINDPRLMDFVNKHSTQKP